VSAPTTDPRLLSLLASDLTLSYFTVEGINAVLGPVPAAALARDQPVPALLRTAEAVAPPGVLTRLWVLGRPVEADLVESALSGVGVAGAAKLGLLAIEGTRVRPLVALSPHTTDNTHWWLASDFSEVVTGRPLRPDHVLGLGGASTTLTRWTQRHQVARALDVGTGCGVQALHLATHAADVVATDISARCLRFAEFNAGLNAAGQHGPIAGRSLDLRRGDLFAPVAGETFDLIVSNPPFVITPRHADIPQYSYRDGLRTGDEIVAQFVREVAAFLTPGGFAQLLGNWEIRSGADPHDVHAKPA